MVGADDLAKARVFYDAIFSTLGMPPANVDSGGRLVYRLPNGVFAVTRPVNGEPASAANGGTIGFACESPEQVAEWHEAGVAHGGSSAENPPGLRENGHGRFFTAYLRDPQGNKLAATHRLVDA